MLQAMTRVSNHLSHTSPPPTLKFVCAVITEPMDFTTVGKKIKAKEYKNKTAFEKDLKLIWENCLRYNMPVSSVSNSLSAV